MQFDPKIKEKMTKSVPDDFTIAEEERDAALTRAFALFSSTNPNGPRPEQPLEPLTWLAVKVLKPYMQKLFEVGDGAETPPS